MENNIIKTTNSSDFEEPAKLLVQNTISNRDYDFSLLDTNNAEKPTGITSINVAQYLLSKIGPLSAMKLQKLVYYCQVWSIVWDDSPLFTDTIEAWTNGPVIRNLYNSHRGDYKVSLKTFIHYNQTKFSNDQIETMDEVIKAYGSKSAQWLSDQTHSEKPWLDAREGLDDNERGNNVISLKKISEYYSSL